MMTSVSLRYALCSCLPLLATAACVSAISTTQSAETLRPGQVMASGATNVSVPVTQVIDALDAAYDLEERYRADSNYQPTEDEAQDYLDAAIGLALNAPGGGMDFMLRYGVARHVDVGLRYSTTGVHGDAKFQFLDQGPGGWAGAISLGYQYHLFQGVVFDVLEYLQIDDFSRHDLEIPLLFGRSFGQPLGSGLALSGRTWFGPKVIVSRVAIDAALQRFDESLSTETTMFYAGGLLGAAIGLSGFEVFAELTVMHLTANATVLGRERDLGGWIVMPTFGVQGRF